MLGTQKVAEGEANYLEAGSEHSCPGAASPGMQPLCTTELPEGLKESQVKYIGWRAPPMEADLKNEHFITEECCMEAGG